ncbi:MAG: DNA mismatch endonuclease Vsr [Clostridiaceae bacterium]|nr:DNA mismatch endonuclease Vsr [Clostridiaceae bacterium]
MADVLTREQRHKNMQNIRSEETKIEIAVRRYLFSCGFRFRKNDKRYPGTPDIVLPKYKVVVFINGCFWHGHKGCKYFVIPKTNTDFWVEKIGKTVQRDRNAIIALEDNGWRVLTLWQCQLSPASFQDTMRNTVNEIKGFANE